jgi:hypothetical protein
MQFLRDLYSQIRPHLSVSRVVAAIMALVAPPVAILVGKLSVVVANWGYHLDPTATTVTFLGVTAAALAAAITAGVKWLDGRAKYEVAQVQEGTDPGSPPNG